MKLSITYEPTKEYLLVKVSGEYDFLSAIFLFHNILKEAWKQNSKNILCDISSMTGFDFNPKDITSRYTIARYLGTTLPKDIRLAILESPKQMNLFGETVIANRGAHVKITSSMTVALKWLDIPVRNHAYQ